MFICSCSVVEFECRTKKPNVFELYHSMPVFMIRKQDD